MAPGDDRMHRVLMALLLLFLGALAPAMAHAQAPSPMISADMTFDEWSELPNKVRYTPGGPVPPYYEPRRMIRKAVAITGGSILGGTYLWSTLWGVADPALYPLLIPVAGPWITIVTSAQAFGFSPPAVWLLAMDGIAQTTGLVLFAWGLVDKQDFLVKKPYGFAVLRVAPALGPERAGLSVSGRF
jgi:hypothetical protein